MASRFRSSDQADNQAHKRGKSGSVLEIQADTLTLTHAVVLFEKEGREQLSSQSHEFRQNCHPIFFCPSVCSVIKDCLNMFQGG